MENKKNTSTEKKIWEGKEVLKGGKWYPMVIEADSIKDANKKTASKDNKRGRWVLSR